MKIRVSPDAPVGGAGDGGSSRGSVAWSTDGRELDGAGEERAVGTGEPGGLARWPFRRAGRLEMCRDLPSTWG